MWDQSKGARSDRRRRGGKAFEWSGGHPALDLVNTFYERPAAAPIENLATYRDFVRFAELAGLIERPLAASLRDRTGSACARATRRARKLREHLYRILTAAHRAEPIPQADLNAITAAIRAAHAARRLVASSPITLADHGWAHAGALEAPLHACALAIERLLSEADRSRLRKCGACDCQVYFVDTSKSRRRRWCSMKNCGNREKQRRWRSGAS
jgi:predicted RNA-binding Zn ribbon-like protein